VVPFRAPFPLSLFRCGLLSRLRPIGRRARARPRRHSTYTPRTCTLHTRGCSGARRLRRLTPSRPRLLALALRARLARCLPLPQRALRACRVARRRAGDAATRCARGGPRRHLPCHGAARLHPHSTKACECRASRKESASKRGTAAGADCLRACLARASPLPWRLSSLPPVRQVVRDQSPVQIAEEAGEQSQEQGVEHVGQRQAFCNREKGGTARVVFARRLRLLPARGRCSAMNPIMLQVGCESACTKINACCCACWRARMSA
jgi:hypothetical protein